MGYRRIRDELDGHKGVHVNDKRVLRICRKCNIKSNIKWKPKSCTRGDRNPDHIAKNYLQRDFHADKPNEKWLTDVSEFKYYNGNEVHKVYLSAILDLYDRRIVTFKISDHTIALFSFSYSSFPIYLICFVLYSYISYLSTMFYRFYLFLFLYNFNVVNYHTKNEGAFISPSPFHLHLFLSSFMLTALHSTYHIRIPADALSVRFRSSLSLFFRLSYMHIFFLLYRILSPHGIMLCIPRLFYHSLQLKFLLQM